VRCGQALAIPFLAVDRHLIVGQLVCVNFVDDNGWHDQADTAFSQASTTRPGECSELLGVHLEHVRVEDGRVQTSGRKARVAGAGRPEINGLLQLVNLPSINADPFGEFALDLERESRPVVGGPIEYPIARVCSNSSIAD
jgi:hypothetical protein